MGQLHYTATAKACTVNYKIRAAEGGTYELYDVVGLGTDYHLYVKSVGTGKTVAYGDTTFTIGATDGDALKNISERLKEICFIAKGLGTEGDAVVDAGVQSLGGDALPQFNLNEATFIV